MDLEIIFYIAVLFGVGYIFMKIKYSIKNKMEQKKAEYSKEHPIRERLKDIYE